MTGVLELLATRGLPASGKTRFARGWVAEDPSARARVSRDDTRAMLHGGWLGTSWQERQVTVVTHGAILDLLRQGVSVVEDGTNLADKHLVALWDIAERTGAAFRVVDLTDVPFEVCVARDAVRPRSTRVGRESMLRMFERHLQGRPRPLPLPPLVRSALETR
ncbi:AAA family ATPase [Micromonospora sp. 15K316]|uniref:AAA family ATPase n=1 Tax=Micromonospora sp. 15K316 TaxID=2530376 RepID=UPI001404F7A6|nr:AAA family ATPase [Micromonospora sp. 15K316]